MTNVISQDFRENIKFNQTILSHVKIHLTFFLNHEQKNND